MERRLGIAIAVAVAVNLCAVAYGFGGMILAGFGPDSTYATSVSVARIPR